MSNSGLHQGLRFVALFALMFGLAACSTSLERTPPPLDSLQTALPPAIPNIPNARYWGDQPPPNLGKYLKEMEAQRAASGIHKDIAAIALSGGGADGAFGAGLMRAWTKKGNRPEFAAVTGVSTGALSAPFVFLGPKYDKTLEELYGGLSPDAYFEQRPLLHILSKVSAADNTPLVKLIEKYADEKMLAEVAREHQRGRRIWVQSSHLDAQRPVIWDLGHIASSGAPNAIEVFRKALLASASIPVAFPPVVFEVEIDGQIYEELHVDGGAISQDTTLSSWQYDMRELRKGRPQSNKPSVIYLIRNGRVDPEASATKYSLMGLAARSVSTMIKSGGVADILVAYESAKLLGADFKVTWIGRDFKYPESEPFDTGYMQALQKYGYDLMMSGNAWEDRPLMFMSDEERLLSPRAGGKRK